MALVVAILVAAPLLFSAPARRAPRCTVGAGASPSLCGVRHSGHVQPHMPTVAVEAAVVSWMNPFRGGSPPPSERLSRREWVKMYRVLGIGEDSSKEVVQKATSRLRRKYANDEQALDRVEAANLWIMTRMVQRSEEAQQRRQQAARMREIGNAPKNLFLKYIWGWVPPNVRQMVEAPDTKHFRWSSGLMGVFALMVLCAPTQATNFIGLGAACCLGLVYQRGRPEPVKDDFGNVGRVQQPNFKEMGASIALAVFGVALGLGASMAIGHFFVDWPVQTLFAITTLGFLWLISLFFKVYHVFEEE